MIKKMFLKIYFLSSIQRRTKEIFFKKWLLYLAVLKDLCLGSLGFLFNCVSKYGVLPEDLPLLAVA